MNTISSYLQLVRRYRFLWAVVVLHFLAIAVVAVYLPFETRQLNGINLWVKPLKFLISVVPYMLTLPGLLSLLNWTDRKKHRIASLIVLSMLVENICIVSQAGRGVFSHYNNSSAYNMIVFNIMALFILINTICAIILFFAILQANHPAQQHIVVAFRYALFLFLLASVGGGFMIAHNQHSIGAADSSAGMFFTNWNRSGGDLRIMHFFGLHSLQILPLLAWYFGSQKRFLTIHLPALGLGIFTTFVFLQALQGKPFLAYQNFRSGPPLLYIRCQRSSLFIISPVTVFLPTADCFLPTDLA